MAAIADLGHELVAAYDIHDSVGILDRYAPEAAFFIEYERFERHLNKLFQKGSGIDYLVVCSPNYLHDSHIRLGLRLQADVICEKPVSLNVHNVESLLLAEAQSARKVWCILQARLHPEVVRLRENLSRSDKTSHRVEIKYITPRGRWYDYSWKGDPSRSGGVETNIGIHLFDLVSWLFGPLQNATCRFADARTYRGSLTLGHSTTHSSSANEVTVDFLLSLQQSDLPAGSQGSLRKFSVDGEEYDLSNNFEDLHKLSYQSILAGQGFGLQDALPAIAIVEKLRYLRTQQPNE